MAEKTTRTLHIHPPKALSISQLVALEEWINKQLEEAYERGKKDGEAKSEDYLEGFSDGWDEGYYEGRYRE